MRKRINGAMLGALLLSGCVTTSPPPDVRQAGPGAFVVDGRIAVKFDSQHSSGDFHWLHEANSDDVTMLAPLGITVAHVRQDAHGAVLETSSGKYVAPDSDQLMQRALGWHLPLQGMPYWLRAKPMPGSPATVARDPNGQVRQLQQDGWDIHYAGYSAATGDGLPRRLIMQRDKLKILLLIDAWKSN